MAMQPKNDFIRARKPSFSVPNNNSKRVHYLGMLMSIQKFEGNTIENEKFGKLTSAYFEKEFVISLAKASKSMPIFSLLTFKISVRNPTGKFE